MREIKFRAWDKVRKEFCYYEPFNHDGSFNSYINVSDDGIDTTYTIEQYTGLKDNNGKEIYEGDIVKYKWLNDYYESAVKWDKRRCSFYFSDKVFNNGDHLEIIGNIHDKQSK